jgi:hypothetical protein
VAHGAGYDRSVSRPSSIAAAAAFALLCGCYSPIGELTATHIEPGGTISAALDAGTPLTTKALADGTVDPMTIVGNSPELVFGLVIGTDTTTAAAAKPMLLANMPVTLSIAGGSQLSVHLGGHSCAATVATIHLTPDGKGNLNGDFAGSGDGCQLGGTLTGVPLMTQ